MPLLAWCYNTLRSIAASGGMVYAILSCHCLQLDAAAYACSVLLVVTDDANACLDDCSLFAAAQVRDCRFTTSQAVYVLTLRQAVAPIRQDIQRIKYTTAAAKGTPVQHLSTG